jgi:Family of unknown function (DUF6790)
MIADIITFVLSNFTLEFLVLGFVFSIVAIMRAPRPVGADVIVEKFISWHVFFAIGATYLYNFVIHVFFGKMAAGFIGWADSPFQFEVGTASLGFALVGFVAAFASFDLRLAAILGPSMFSLGAAVGHVRQMVVAHDFAPGNAGVIFWTDIAIPVIGFILLALQWYYGRPQREI